MVRAVVQIERQEEEKQLEEQYHDCLHPTSHNVSPSESV